MDGLARFFICLGLLVNSALYSTGCFVAGLLLQSPLAWKFALATAGVSYIAYTAQEMGARKVAVVFVILSIITGAVSGVSLIFA